MKPSFRALYPNRGFTLVELLVVVSVIGILAAVVYANFNSANPAGRDAKRQADLRILQGAIEQYKQRYGRYPAAGTGSGCAPTVSGFVTESCNTYIDELVPEFIERLPRDPRRGSGLGYSYLTNADGSVYKLMAAGTAESSIDMTLPFQSCDVSYCSESCTSNSYYSNSLAVWGGFALQLPADIYAADPLDNLTAEQQTEALSPTTDIICRQPSSS